MPSDNAEQNAAGLRPIIAGRTIYVRMIVDVGGVLRDRPDGGTATPTPVGFDRGQLIIATTAGTTDSGTGEITLNACAGDTLRFVAKSGSNNFEHSVLVGGIGAVGPDKVLDDFALLSLPRMDAAPTTYMNNQSAKFVQQVSWFWQCAVIGEGTQVCGLVLALHDRGGDGRPRFAGLYRWDLRFTIHCDQAPETAPEEKPS